MNNNKIVIELKDIPENGLSVVAMNIAAAIKNSCQTVFGEDFKFYQDGQEIKKLFKMIPQKAYFRLGEKFKITVDTL